MFRCDKDLDANPEPIPYFRAQPAHLRKVDAKPIVLLDSKLAKAFPTFQAVREAQRGFARAD